MLGSVESAENWHFAACGKHPVAKDYFRLGADGTLIRAFSDWMEKGYRMLSGRRSPSSGLCSWRFWAKGSKRDTVVCGVGRDSSDSIGRIYPMLIMGTGPLAGWADKWDLIPFTFEGVWSQMEYMSTKRFMDLKQLEDELRFIKPPSPQWGDFITQRGNPEEIVHDASRKRSTWYFQELNKKAEYLAKKAEFFVPLEDGLLDDQLALAGLWHYFLKNKAKAIPNAVFMGGLPSEAFMAVFKRPLVAADFVRLWSDWIKDTGG